MDLILKTRVLLYDPRSWAIDVFAVIIINFEI